MTADDNAQKFLLTADDTAQMIMTRHAQKINPVAVEVMPTRPARNHRPFDRNRNCVCHDDVDMLCEFNDDDVDTRKCFDCGKFWDYCFDEFSRDRQFLSVVECCPYFRECFFRECAR